jgi:hypothetical protein
VEQFSRQLMGETEENQEKSLKTHSFLTDIWIADLQNYDARWQTTWPRWSETADIRVYVCICIKFWFLYLSCKQTTIQLYPNYWSSPSRKSTTDPFGNLPVDFVRSLMLDYILFEAVFKYITKYMHSDYFIYSWHLFNYYDMKNWN